MDGRIMADIAKKDPDMITPEVFQDLYWYMFNYCKKALFLPGQIEQWVTVCDLNTYRASFNCHKELESELERGNIRATNKKNPRRQGPFEFSSPCFGSRQIEKSLSRGWK